MAVLVRTQPLAQDLNQGTPNTLTASDAYTYQPGDMILIRNLSGGAITLLFDGDGGSTISPPGGGIQTVSAGYSTGSIATSGHRIIFADTIAEYLKGTVTITGGSGALLLIWNRK